VIARFDVTPHGVVCRRVWKKITLGHGVMIPSACVTPGKATTVYMDVTKEPHRGFCKHPKHYV